MSSEQEMDGQTTRNARIVAQQIKAYRLRRGWEVGQLATEAKVSRTTLYHLERGRISSPRASTLHRIARALGVPIESLTLENSSKNQLSTNSPAQASEGREAAFFDRVTNPVVTAVAEAHPELFEGWTVEEWDELYSTFGTGGALNQQGVICASEAMNQRREVIEKLKVLMETHLADVAANLVNSLCRMVLPNESADGQTPADHTGESRKGTHPHFPAELSAHRRHIDA